MKIIEKEKLSDLVPHRGRMFIIDRITDWDTAAWKISSETKITEDFMFYDKTAEGVPNYAIFEIAAQTVSALTGIFAKENNLPPNMGMILSVSGLKISVPLIKAGQTVSVQAQRESDVGSVYGFTTKIFIDGQECGGGKLTVMEAGSEGL